MHYDDDEYNNKEQEGEATTPPRAAAHILNHHHKQQQSFPSTSTTSTSCIRKTRSRITSALSLKRREARHELIKKKERGTARWRELFCIYLTLIADAVTVNVIIPYAPSWVRDTFKVDNVGLYSGLLVGSFSIARALSSPFFGWLSDSVGRRLLLAGGLLASGVLTLIGGLTSKFWVCFGLRFLAGLLNASEAVASAAIADNSTGQLRQVAFGYSKAASQIAKILTSMIGGFTYNLQPDPLFKNIPGYSTVLLSQLISSGSCLVGVLTIFFLYREGHDFHVRVKAGHYDELETLEKLAELEEEETIQMSAEEGEEDGAELQQGNEQNNDEEQQHQQVAAYRAAREGGGGGQQHVAIMSPSRAALVERYPSSLPSLGLAHDEGTLYNLFSTYIASTRPIKSRVLSSSGPPSPRSHPSSLMDVSSTTSTPSSQQQQLPPLFPRGDSTFVDRPTFVAGLVYMTHHPLLMRLICVFSMTSFFNGGLFVSITLLAIDKNGFDFGPKDASIVMLVFGCWATIFSAFFFKPIITSLGSKRANALGLIGTGIGILGMPLAAYFVRLHTWQMWVCIVVSVVIFGSGYMLINPILIGLISQHTAADMQGLVQGCTTFVSQIFIGVGPVAAGALCNYFFDKDMPIVPFLSLTAGYVLCMLLVHGVPREELEIEED